MSENTKLVKIKGVVFWAFLDRQNDLSNAYMVDICQLSDAACRALEAQGIEIKNKGDGRGSFITCKSKQEIYAFNPDHSRIVGIGVGNGSECEALIGTYAWKFKAKSGVSPSIKRLTITKLVEFNSGGEAEEYEDEEAL